MILDTSVLAVKASQEWLAWLDDLANQTGMPRSVIAERAIAKFAQDLGAPSPPRRVVESRGRNARRRQKAAAS